MRLLRIPVLLLVLMVAGPAAAAPIVDVATPVAPPADTRPSCVELLWENAVYQLPHVNGVPALLGLVGSVVIVDWRCPLLSLVKYLVEGGGDPLLP